MSLQKTTSTFKTLSALSLFAITSTTSADTLQWDLPGHIYQGDFFTASYWNNLTQAQDPALQAPTTGDDLLFIDGKAPAVQYHQSTVLSLGQIDVTGGNTEFRFTTGFAGLSLTNGLTLSGTSTTFAFDGHGVQYDGLDVTTMDIGGGISVGQNSSDNATLSFNDDINVTSNGNVTVGTASGGVGKLILSDSSSSSTLTVNGTLSVEAGSTFHQKYISFQGLGLTAGALDLGGDFSRLVWDSGDINLTNSGLTVGAGGNWGATVNITNDGVDRYLGDDLHTFIGWKRLSLSDDLIIESGGSLSLESVRDGHSWTDVSGIDLYTGEEYSVKDFAYTSVSTTGDVLFTGDGSITLNAWGELSAVGTIDLGSNGTLTLAHEGASASANDIISSGGTLDWRAGTVRLSNTNNLIIGTGGRFGDTLDLTGVYSASAPTTPGSRILDIGGAAFVANGGTLNVGEANRFKAPSLTVQDGGVATLSGDVSPYSNLGYTGTDTAFIEFVRDTDRVAGESTATLGAMVLDDLTIDTNGTFNLSGGHLQVDQITAAAGSSFNWTSGVIEFTAAQTLDSNFILGENVTVGTNQFLSGSFTADDVTDTIEVDGGHLRLTGLTGFSEGQLLLTSGTLESNDLGGDLSIGSGQLMGANVTLNAGQRILTGPTPLGQITPFQILSGGSLTLDGGELQTFTPDLVAAGGSFTFNSGRLVMFGEDITLEIGGLLGNTLSLTNDKTLELEDRFLGTNEGKLTVSNGASLDLDGGTLKVTALDVQTGGTLTLNSGTLEADDLSAVDGLTTNAVAIVVESLDADITVGAIPNSGGVRGSLTANTTSGLVTLNGGHLSVININGGLDFNGGTVERLNTIQGGLNVNGPGEIGFISLYDGLTQSNALSSVNAGAIEGDVNLSDGTLSVGVMTGNLIQGAGLAQIEALTGSATINGGTFEAIDVTGTVTNNGGIVAPGSSPAISTFGSYIQDGTGTLEMEIGGTIPGSTGYDQLIVTGSSELAGILDITLIDLGGGIFAPQEGDTFVLFDFQGAVTGWFNAVNLPELAEGLSWTNNLATNGTLGVVPEPKSFAILAGLLSLGVVLSRRRK